MDPTVVPSPRCPFDVPLLVSGATSLLRAGVPLTLLMDLADPSGPDSHRRYADEGVDPGWRTVAG